MAVKEKSAKSVKLTAAREKYDASLQRLAKAIEGSRKARDASRQHPDSEAKKTAYANARQEHKEALDEIKTTRSNFREVRAQELAKA